MSLTEITYEQQGAAHHCKVTRNFSISFVASPTIIGDRASILGGNLLMDLPFNFRCERDYLWTYHLISVERQGTHARCGLPSVSFFVFLLRILNFVIKYVDSTHSLVLWTIRYTIS